MNSNTFIHVGLGWIGDRGGGLERYQHGICCAHRKLGVDVRAWVQSRSAIRDDISYPVTVFASPEEPRRVKVRKLRASIVAELAGEDVTCVSHHASVSGPLAKQLRMVPHVVHFHGPWSDEARVEGAAAWKIFLQRRVERTAYHSADRIITLSEAFKEVVIQRYGVDPSIVRVVPGAIDAELANPGVSRQAAREMLGWPTNRPIVLTVRRLVKRVGIDVLLDAIVKLHESSAAADILLMIGGSGPLKAELAAVIEAKGIGNCVRLLGFVPDEQLSLAYRAADVSIVPTQALEGFGLVMLESLAAGTPCVVTPVGSLPEVMTGLSSNLILPDKKASDIQDWLRAFARGEAQLPDDETCRQYVRQNYDWSIIAPRVLEVYREAR